jgi:hypothetical protein
MATCDVLVAGFVPSIKQPKTMDCWITGDTMLLSWRDKTKYTVDAVAADAGEPFTTFYKKNTGLPISDTDEFVKAIEVAIKAPQSYSIEGWRDMLKAHGPLFVVTAQKLFANKFAVHARVLIGMTGDCSPAKTAVTLIDPADASDASVPYAVFLETYETLAGNNVFTFQVIHCR